MSFLQGSLSSDSKVMVAVFFVILVAFIGFSVPHIVFSPLFLDSNDLFTENTSDMVRYVLYGLAIAVFPVGQVISLPLLGKLSDILGRKKILIITLIIAVLGIVATTLGVLFASVYAIIIGRFVTGLAEGNVAIAQAIVSDSENKQLKEKRFAYITIAVNLGFVVGPLLGGYFATIKVFSFGSAYSMPFIFAILSYILCLIIVAFCIPGGKKNPLKEQKQEQASKITSFSMLKNQNLKFPYFISFLTNIGIYSMFLYYTVFLVKQFSFNVVNLAIASALLSVPLIISSLIVSKIKISYKSKLSLGCFLLSFGLLMYGFSFNLTFLVFAAILASFGISFLQVITSLIVSDNAPDYHQGQALGIYRAIVVLAEVLIALLGGLLSYYHVSLPFVAGALCCLFVLYLVYKNRNSLAKNTL